MSQITLTEAAIAKIRVHEAPQLGFTRELPGSYFAIIGHGDWDRYEINRAPGGWVITFPGRLSPDHGEPTLAEAKAAASYHWNFQLNAD